MTILCDIQHLPFVITTYVQHFIPSLNMTHTTNLDCTNPVQELLMTTLWYVTRGGKSPERHVSFIKASHCTVYIHVIIMLLCHQVTTYICSKYGPTSCSSLGHCDVMDDISKNWRLQNNKVHNISLGVFSISQIYGHN